MLRFHREILKEFKSLDAKVILYGSVAKGNYRLDSDIDIAVVTDNKKVRELAEKIADRIYLKTGKLVSLKFLSPKDFEKETSFIKEIKSGKIIR